MKKAVLFVIAAVIAASCGTTKDRSLYNWGGPKNVAEANDIISPYEQIVYKQFKRENPKDLCRLIEVYERMITKPGGLRQMPPPGICAEYGYLLLLPETADIFEQNASDRQKSMFDASGAYSVIFPQYGLRLMQKEIDFYPESAPFIQPLLNKFKGQQK